MTALGAPLASTVTMQEVMVPARTTRGQKEATYMICLLQEQQGRLFSCALKEGLVCIELSILPLNLFFVSGSFSSKWQWGEVCGSRANLNLPPGPQHLAKCILCWLSHI